MGDINFLWQDHSAYDEDTAIKVADLNPDKFIMNIDGPGSDFSNPRCGPSITQLVKFIGSLKGKGFTGVLAMHPDATKGDYEHDWNEKGNLPKRDASQAWKTYCDYFIEINKALYKNNLPQFKEILIETESSYIPRTFKAFGQIKKYLPSGILVSTTGDWNGDRKNLGVDCFYPQLYDMAYVDGALGGENPPSTFRADFLASHIVDIIKEKPCMLNDPNVFFTFSYCFNDADAPVFGQAPRVWPQKEFVYFLEEFKKNLSNHTKSTTNTGVWHSSGLINAWKLKNKITKSHMINKSEIILILTTIILTILLIANLTILFKIHDDQQIIKDKIEKLGNSQYLNAFLKYERGIYE